MTNERKSTRLGDLLVERGVITRDQLLQAIELQQTRRHQAVQAGAPDSYKQELGEALIELGFINRNQLKSSLGWQRRIRKTTAVMVFIAPLLTAACGGGGSSPPQSSVATSSKTSSSSTPGNSSVGSASSISSSSVAAISSSTSSTTAGINGPVQVYWNPPKQRENGDFLDITEIGGYELRYKRKTDSRYTTIIINDGYLDVYYFDNLQGDYEFQIAAFDITGLYSAFVNIKALHK